MTDHFDAEQWDRIYTAGKGSGVVFRRSADLAEETCLRISRPGQIWLDLGCGTGHLAARLSRAGRSVIGVDHDPAMIDFAKKRFLNNPSTDSFTFVTADACHLPFEDESADGVAAVSLAGCLTDPRAFYREMYRVLRPGGFAVITFTNRDSRLPAINAFLRKITSRAARDKDLYVPVRLYRYDRAAEDLKKIGFQVISVRYYNFFLNWGNRLLPPGSLSERMEGLDRFKIRRRLGRNFILTAQKPLSA